MLDPRGHLNEKEIFQFQTLSYSSSMDSIESIEKVLYGTSMYNRKEYQNQGSMINMEKTYSNINKKQNNGNNLTVVKSFFFFFFCSFFLFCCHCFPFLF